MFTCASSQSAVLVLLVLSVLVVLRVGKAAGFCAHKDIVGQLVMNIASKKYKRREPELLFNDFFTK
jgi:hypothetical protein